MFPNPASNQVTINLNVPSAQLKIYSMQGQFVIKKVLTRGNNNIDISRLNAGVYLINIELNNKIVTKKLVVQ